MGGILPVASPVCQTGVMISVVIPTFNSAATLAATLECLIPAAVDGLVREVIVADGGSTDATLAIADGTGADTVPAGRSRAQRLIAGAQRARFPWLLFINPDCVLAPGWESDAAKLMAKIDTGAVAPSAAVFGFGLDDDSIAARVTEAASAISTRALGTAYGEQGLLIPRTLYGEAGGFQLMPMLEDVEFTRRIGRRRLVRLQTKAASSALSHRQDGFGAHALRHAGCIFLYGLNVPLRHIVWLSGRRATRVADAELSVR
jgi:glycosyltransferase involved in cell wall biosynthesis